MAIHGNVTQDLLEKGYTHLCKNKTEHRLVCELEMSKAEEHTEGEGNGPGQDAKQVIRE